ncbi:hypothetical protein ABFT23_03380 [Nocardioides sp. C4-1]|uniref:DUF6916 family protein n=1 Tax=Nocardioides sp. C4-1 TaxID=3151851 RepID=UPI00326696F9
MTDHLDTLADPEATGRPVAATRRSVITAAGVVGAAVAVPVGLRFGPELFQGAAAAAPVLDRASFTPHLGRRFTARLGDTTAGLELVEVLDLNGAPAGDTDSFVLRFTPDRDLPQDSYEISRTGLDAGPVFLVPEGPEPGDALVAVFNRTVDRRGVAR